MKVSDFQVWKVEFGLKVVGLEFGGLSVALGLDWGFGLEVWGRDFMNLALDLRFEGFRFPGLESRVWT